MKTDLQDNFNDNIQLQVINNTTKAANTSIEQLEPGEVQHKVTVVVEDDELEPGEVRR